MTRRSNSTMGTIRIRRITRMIIGSRANPIPLTPHGLRVTGLSLYLSCFALPSYMFYIYSRCLDFHKSFSFWKKFHGGNFFKYGYSSAEKLNAPHILWGKLLEEMKLKRAKKCNESCTWEFNEWSRFKLIPWRTTPEWIWATVNIFFLVYFYLCMWHLLF